MHDDSTPWLRGGPVHGRPAGSVVLVLHGGREHSVEPTSRVQLSYVRMFDFYWGLRRASRAGAVYLLRFRVRGWNAGVGVPDPVQDAHWALAEISERHPDVPIGLLGHSMGARAAFAVAGHPAVAGVCGLAPWLPAQEPLPPPREGQRFVIAHGTSDTMTSAPLSREYAERLRREGHQVARFELPGARHAMLDRPWLWHGFGVGTTLGLTGDGPLPSGVAAALDPATADGVCAEMERYDVPVV